MREIKFRAWNKETKEMWSPQDLVENDYYLYAHGAIEFHLLRYDDRHMASEEFELMQYTGLKDKNGKEIYDLDIISRPNGAWGDFLEVVKWCDSGGAYYLEMIGMRKDKEKFLPIENKGKGYFSDNKKHFNNIEVIGNLYENPELVENA